MLPGGHAGLTLGEGGMRRTATTAGLLGLVALLTACSDGRPTMSEEDWVSAFCVAAERFNEANEPFMTPGDEDVPGFLVHYQEAMVEYAAALRKLVPPDSVAPFQSYLVDLFEAGAAVDSSQIADRDTGEAVAALMRTAAAGVTPPTLEPAVLDRLREAADRTDDCPRGVFGPPR